MNFLIVKHVWISVLNFMFLTKKSKISKRSDINQSIMIFSKISWYFPSLLYWYVKKSCLQGSVALPPGVQLPPGAVLMKNTDGQLMIMPQVNNQKLVPISRVSGVKHNDTYNYSIVLYELRKEIYSLISTWNIIRALTLSSLIWYRTYNTITS